VATEDVVWLLQQQGIACGVDLERLVDSAAWIFAQLGRKPLSKVATALLARRDGNDQLAMNNHPRRESCIDTLNGAA
jgi:hypothetical protein